MEKKCNGCKKILSISQFTLENKVYGRCNDCRKQASNKPKYNKCEVCGISACFNVSGQKNGRFCKEHKQQDMVDVIHDKCLSECCNKRPAFNIVFCSFVLSMIILFGVFNNNSFIYFQF